MRASTRRSSRARSPGKGSSGPPWAKAGPMSGWIPDRLWCSPFGLGHKTRPQGEGLLFASGDRRPAVPSECTGGAGPRCWQQEFGTEDEPPRGRGVTLQVPPPTNMR